jgi:ATP-dependent Lon protease
LLAAHRGNIKTVIIPADNERDLAEIPDEIKADLEIRPAKLIDEVLEYALENQPTPLEGDKKNKEKKKPSQEDISAGKGENLVKTH